jgi:hypothetical protein
MKDAKKFIPSIDNLSKVKEVQSIMVVPLFGHDEPGIKSASPNVVGVL